MKTEIDFFLYFYREKYFILNIMRNILLRIENL